MAAHPRPFAALLEDFWDSEPVFCRVPAQPASAGASLGSGMVCGAADSAPLITSVALAEPAACACLLYTSDAADE